MRPSILFQSLLAALLFTGCAPQSEQPPTSEQPNIIFVMVDDMGMFDAGAYGSDAVQTPNMDRMAAEGAMFTQAYSGAPVCAPARSTLITGRHMGKTSVRSNSGGASLLDEDVTVAELLRDAGYANGGFGKWGLGDLDTPGVPERQGFDRFFGYYHQVHAHYFYPEYLIDSGEKAPLPANEGFYEEKREAGPVDPNAGTFSAYVIFDEMKDFLREHKDRPFFCYAPWTPPHARYELPADDPAWQLYKDKPWSVEAKVHAAFCTMMDRHLGETLALLDELGIDEKTIVFFASDNGASQRFDGELNSSGPFKGKKGTVWEGGIRVPLLARWPGKIAPGTKIDAPVYFPDFLPTALELAGASASLPSGIDGVSLLPELLGSGMIDRGRHLYWEWSGAHFEEDLTPDLQAHRHGEWKILRHDRNAPWELYNLAADPGEENNLASDHPERVSEMAAWVEANRVDARPQPEPEKPEGQRWR